MGAMDRQVSDSIQFKIQKKIINIQVHVAPIQLSLVHVVLIYILL